MTTNGNDQVKRLAVEFTRVLKGWATPEQWAKMVADNAASPGDGACASHDFCDANQAMIDAYTKVMGKEPVANDDKDIAFITEAWNLAKRVWQEPELRVGVVSMDGLNDDLTCFIEHDAFWNGFTCPYFTKGQAWSALVMLEKDGTIAPGWTVDDTKVSCKFASGDADEETQDFAAEEFALHGKLYGIGNRGWCWSEVYPNWNADGTVEAERFGDIVERVLAKHHGIRATFELAPCHIKIMLNDSGAHLVAGTMNGLWECDLIILDGAGAEESAAVNAIARDSDPYEVAKWLARGHSLATKRLAVGLGAKRKPDRLDDLGVDSAAVMGIAVSLNDAAKASKGNISEAYLGADQFMRECMRVAVLFERWANENVNFDEFSEVWPYMLEDKFGKAVVAEFGDVLKLAEFDKAACAAIAARLELPMKEGV